MPIIKSKIWSLRREIKRKVSEIGIWATCILCLRKAIDYLFASNKHEIHPFDLQYGTDTSGIIEPGALDISSDNVIHAVRYQSARVEVFLDILNSLSIPHNEYLFIDMGSGKGRALLLASSFHFKKIIGIELSENLHTTACRNIQIYNDKNQKCHDIQSICENAEKYQIPLEKIVFYLFNPFDEYVSGKFLHNIESSLRIFNRDIYIAYLKPIHKKMFDQASFLKVIKETESYIIYKSKND